MPTAVPREKYLEMDWRAADSCCLEGLQALHKGDLCGWPGTSRETVWPDGGRWWGIQPLEHSWRDSERPQGSRPGMGCFEWSISFWHFRDAYLADFRQDPTESTVDLDLHIKQTIRWCQWKKETEEEQMIDLLYHATIYYEICKYIQESEPNMLKYKMVIEKAKVHERNYLE